MLFRVSTSQFSNCFIYWWKVGETVLVEPAKCSSLYPKNFGSHCNLCFSRLIAPIGCTDCASVAFCSIECRDKALSSYHKFECKFLDMLIGSGMSILCQIALKIVTNCKTPDEALKQGKILLAGLCVHSQARKNEDYFKRGKKIPFYQKAFSISICQHIL